MGTWQWNLKSLFGFRNSPEISQDASSRKLDTSAVTNNRFYHLYYPLMDDKKAEIRIRDEQLVAHSVRSHGIAVARNHMNDWLILILLAVIMMVLSRIHPFYRFVGKDMMTDLKYPLKENTVPLWVVPIYAVLFPMGVFMFFYFYRRDVYDLHHAILGLLFSVLITGVITDAIKDAVGRPRPDFFWRCFPDGKDFYDRFGDVICHGDSNVVSEGHKSFPSGHTSWSFSGLGFLSLYLSGKVRVFDRKGHVAKLCMVFLPLLVASLIGISRVDDYWHHWQDVFAGAIIVIMEEVNHVSRGGRWQMVSEVKKLGIHTFIDAGITVATFCYLQFFAPPYHAEGWGPYAFFRAMEESRSNAQESRPPLTQANVASSDAHLALDDLESAMT